MSHRSRDTLTIMWGYCPVEVRGALRPILLDYLWLVPSWCQNIYVRWDAAPADSDSSLSTSAQPEYRQAQFNVLPGWLGHIEGSRRTMVIHELLHLPLAPMVHEHGDLAERLTEDGSVFAGYAQEQWRRVFEGSVQDLAVSIGMLPGPFPPVPYVEVEDDDQAKLP